MDKVNKVLTETVNTITEITGRPVVFVAAVCLVILWFIAGIFFGYDDLWFNILDVFVFLTTFFLVFVVQSSQNADTKAMQDKLDEIIKSLPNAANAKTGEEKDIKRGKKEI